MEERFWQHSQRNSGTVVEASPNTGDAGERTGEDTVRADKAAAEQVIRKKKGKTAEENYEKLKGSSQL